MGCPYCGANEWTPWQKINSKSCNNCGEKVTLHPYGAIGASLFAVTGVFLMSLWTLVVGIIIQYVLIIYFVPLIKDDENAKQKKNMINYYLMIICAIGSIATLVYVFFEKGPWKDPNSPTGLKIIMSISLIVSITSACSFRGKIKKNKTNS